ncbi:unnamed protein product [Dicrocoelium dendriticum]|nr:unnamed protein product [Dicrocoelium dendriticum]
MLHQRIMHATPVFFYISLCLQMFTVSSEHPMYSFQRSVSALLHFTDQWRPTLAVTPEETRLLTPALIYTPNANLLEFLNNQFLANDTECYLDIRNILNDILARKPGSFAWLDASGKPPPGISGGALHWPGSFDLCLSISTKTYPGSHVINPLYCSLLIIPTGKEAFDKPVTGVNIGLCVPRTCSIQQLSALIDATSLSDVAVDKSSSFCHSSPAGLPKDTWFWIAISLLLFGLILFTFGSAMDLLAWMQWRLARERGRDWLRQFMAHSVGSTDIDTTDIEHLTDTASSSAEDPEQNLVSLGSERQNKSLAFTEFRCGYFSQRGLCSNILGAFSPIFNLHQLWYSERPLIVDPEGKFVQYPLSCLDGTRFLTMCWIIFGHCVVFIFHLSNNPDLYLPHSLRRWTFQAVVSGTLSVDTFFFMSGLLASYGLLPRFSNHLGCARKIRFWICYVLHRVIRLTPAYVLVLLLYTGLFIHLNDGPLYPQRADLLDVQYCRHHWWVTYLNNFMYTDRQCMSWTWYLANEFQFSVLLAPIFISLVNCQPAPIILSDLTLTVIFLAVLTISYGLAVPLTILTEFPLITIERLVRTR